MSVYELSNYSKKKTQPDEWDEPIGFDKDTLPDIKVDDVPEWAGDYINAVAESVQVAKDAPTIAFITLLSSILSRKFVVKPSDDWTESLVIFSVVAMASSERKSPSADKINRPLLEFEQVRADELKESIVGQKAWLKAKNKQLERLYTDFSKAKEDDERKDILNEIKSIEQEIDRTEIINNPRYVTADATPEALADLMHKNNEKISILSAEGKEVFDMMSGRYSKNGQSNIDIYLKSYTGEPTSIDRKGGDPILLDNPCMPVGLFVQPSVIQGIGEEFQDRGLTSRFLFSLPKTMAGHRNMTPESIPFGVKQKYYSAIETMLRYEYDNQVLTLEEEANQLFLYHRTGTEEMYKNEDLSESFKSWLGKLDGNLIRIAALFHIAEHAPNGMESVPDEIGMLSVKRAMNLKEYFISHAMKAYGSMGVDENDEDAKYTLEKITELNKENITQRELMRKTRKFKSVDSLRPALDQLEERGYIKTFTLGKKVDITVNPKLLKNA